MRALTNILIVFCSFVVFINLANAEDIQVKIIGGTINIPQDGNGNGNIDLLIFNKSSKKIQINYFEIEINEKKLPYPEIIKIQPYKYGNINIKFPSSVALRLIFPSSKIQGYGKPISILPDSLLEDIKTNLYTLKVNLTEDEKIIFFKKRLTRNCKSDIENFSEKKCKLSKCIQNRINNNPNLLSTWIKNSWNAMNKSIENICIK